MQKKIIPNAEISKIFALSFLILHNIYLYFSSQPCPDGLDFRAVQCTAYNDQPYDGETVEWHPYYDEESPCTLMCVDSKGRVEEMSPRVRDGTRCRLGSLDMCIDGVCQVSETDKILSRQHQVPID